MFHIYNIEEFEEIIKPYSMKRQLKYYNFTKDCSNGMTFRNKNFTKDFIMGIERNQNAVEFLY